MYQRVDQICEALRLNLTNVASGVDNLKAKIDKIPRQTEQDIRNHLEHVQLRDELHRVGVSAAKSVMRDWVKNRKIATNTKIAEWKSKRDISKLQKHAAQAERTAAAAIILFMAAIDDVEQAAFEAYLARIEANSTEDDIQK